METCANENDGDYDATACDVAGLHTIEPSLPTGPESPLKVEPEGNGYSIDVESAKTGNIFSIDRLPGGGITYPCEVVRRQPGRLRPDRRHSRDLGRLSNRGANPRSAVVARTHAVTMIGMIQHLAPLGLRRRNGLQRE